MIISL
ncbi:unnamed protein product [Leptidea sinapis]